jgi:hypothetical protein
MDTNVERRATTSFRIQPALPLFIVAIGLMLLGYMVTVEGEPGLVPLLMLAIGTVWFFLARQRQRRVLAKGDIS